MSNITKITTLIAAFITFLFPLFAQENPDDYWLNHGFASGETIYTNTGFFYDDGGDSLYNPGQDWFVNFCSENGNPITLDFNGFRTDYRGGDYGDWDFMSIDFDGTVPLVAYDDDTPQFSFTSPNGCIRFGFKSQPEGISIPDSGWIAEISANPPPFNNDPCSAADLQVGNTCNPDFFTNKGSWDTRDLGSPSCHAFFGGDVWFSAVVPDSGKLKIETFSGSLKYAIMVLYTGSCGSLVENSCVDNPGLMPTYTFTGLTAGETVYIRIFGDQAKSGTFGICATDPTAEISGFSGPGGVGDYISNRLWLKADSGVLDATSNPASEGSDIQTWEDQSGNENDVIQENVTAQPNYILSGINAMPSVVFDGSQNYLSDTIGQLAAPVEIFTVNDFSVTKDQAVLSLGDANDLNTLSIGREDISNQYYTFTNGKQYGQVLPAEAQVIDVSYAVNSPFHAYSLNGTSQTVNFSEGQASTNGRLNIGTDKDKNDFLDGKISEVIIYSKRLNLAQEIIVRNYLAAKYNIMIEDKYYNFQNTHPYDLAGIGRVDQYNIHSRAQSAGIISIGGASELDDGEFAFIGHDGGDMSNWTSEEIPLDDPDILRLEREWKMGAKGNGPGTLTIILEKDKLPDLPEDYLAYNIVVDDDGDFSEGAEFYGLVPSGNELIVNDVSVGKGEFITIMAVRATVNFSSPASSDWESVERPLISVELNYAISDPVTVGYSVTGGTAVKGEDYSLNDGEILFNPGERIKDIIPLIFEDTIIEVPDEYFTIQLLNADAGVNLGDTIEHTYTILDNDLSLFITANDSTIGECANSVATLTANVSGQGPFNYSWTPAAGLSDPASGITEASPLVTTTYVLTVTDGLGGNIEDSIEIVVEPVPDQPVVVAGGSTDICEGDSVILSAPLGFDYNWSNGSTEQSVKVTEAGDYSVVVIDDNGCESVSSNIITVNVNSLPAQPVISAEGDTEICTGGSVVLSAPEGFEYEWSNGETTRSIEVTATGNYSIVVKNAEGCSSPPSEEVAVLVNEIPGKPEITTDKDTEICDGDSVVLSAPEGFDYMWSTGEDTRSIIVKTEGDYTVTAYNGVCASPLGDAVTVSVNPIPDPPVISPEGPITINQGESVELTASEAEGYLWSSSESTRIISADASGQYTVRAISAAGCESTSSDPVEVTVLSKYPAPEVMINGETTFCEGESVTLSVEESYAYNWSNGANTQFILVTEPGSYTVTVEDEEGFESEVSDPVVVEVLSNPVVDADVTDVLCFNSSDGNISLDISGGTEPYQVNWDNSMSGEILSNLTAGSYTATVTDANGCSTLNEVEVAQAEEIVLDAQVTDASCPEANDGEIDVSATGGTSPYTFSLNNEMGTSFDGLLPGTYQVEALDINNCEQTSSFTVNYVSETCFVIPDIITPNGDGKNDEWIIEGLELYPNVTVEIFDRWGKRVFYSRGYDTNFDGRYNGKDLPMESYHYIIDLKDGSPVIIGNITIVR